MLYVIRCVDHVRIHTNSYIPVVLHTTVEVVQVQVHSAQRPLGNNSESCCAVSLAARAPRRPISKMVKSPRTCSSLGLHTQMSTQSSVGLIDDLPILDTLWKSSLEALHAAPLVLRVCIIDEFVFELELTFAEQRVCTGGHAPG